MKALVGDHLVIKGNKVGQAARAAVILEARGPEGDPPFFVKWLDDGHEGLFFPGPNARIEHREEPRRS
jgi:hypothetical protein